MRARPWCGGLVSSESLQSCLISRVVHHGMNSCSFISRRMYVLLRVSMLGVPWHVFVDFVRCLESPSRPCGSSSLPAHQLRKASGFHECYTRWLVLRRRFVVWVILDNCRHLWVHAWQRVTVEQPSEHMFYEIGGMKPGRGTAKVRPHTYQEPDGSFTRRVLVYVGFARMV